MARAKIRPIERVEDKAMADGNPASPPPSLLSCDEDGKKGTEHTISMSVPQKVVVVKSQKCDAIPQNVPFRLKSPLKW